MSESDIQITIDNQASRFLRDEFGPARFHETVKRGMERGMLRVQQQIPEYPPPRTYTQVSRGSALWSKGARKVSGQKGRWWASSYRRTGTLGRSITTKVEDSGAGVKGVIGTNVSVKTESSGYAQYVIGMPEEQAWFHRDRWWNLAKEVEKHVDDIVNAINAEIDATINR